MSSEKDNILEINQYMKSDKTPYIIYGDMESLIKKIDGFTNNPGNPSAIKMSEHLPCGHLPYIPEKISRKNFVHLQENKRKI